MAWWTNGFIITELSGWKRLFLLRYKKKKKVNYRLDFNPQGENTLL